MARLLGFYFSLLMAGVLAMGCSLFESGDGQQQPPPTVPAGVIASPTPQPQTAAPQSTGSQSPDGVPVVVTSVHPFVWPAFGPITSFMGPEHPTGIDIGDEGSRRVRAAARGTVVLSGGDDSHEFGIHVEIDHGNGLTSLYGHMALSLVETGDVVDVGESIGIKGATGISDGVHLHFEVRSDGRTLDPLHVLPVEGSDTNTLRQDCGDAPFRLPAGADSTFDFGFALAQDESLLAAALNPPSLPSVASTEITSRSELRFVSAVDFSGPEEDTFYNIEVTIDGPTDRTVSCQVVVEKREVEPTFYARATATPDPEELVEGEDEDGADGDDEFAGAQPAATPTPTPIWIGPNFNRPTATPMPQPPATIGDEPQSPSYNRPPAPTPDQPEPPSYDRP